MRKVQCFVGAEKGFPRTHGTVVKLGEGGECALFYDAGNWRAVGSLCPHQNASLEGAEVSGGQVVCKRHGYRFDLTTGDCTTIGGYGLPVFSVKEQDGELFVTYCEYDD